MSVSPPSAFAGDAPRRRATSAVLAIAVAGAALRLAAARGDLWLDEIWSVALARQAGSAWQVLTGIHHDNNHHLNTLWLLLAGDASPVVSRLLSVLAGFATIVVGAAAPVRFGSRERIATAVLLSFSYVLVVYQSEARGYGLALLFSVASYQAQGAWLRTRRWGFLALLAASATLGILSHLGFVIVLVACLAWAFAQQARNQRADRGLLTALAVPVLALLGLAWVDLRFLERGGGPESTVGEALRRLGRYTLGLPGGGLDWIAVPFLLAAAWQVVALRRERNASWTFFATVAMGGPLVALLAPSGSYVAARYFLCAVPFLLMLVAMALCDAASRLHAPAWAAPLAALLVAAPSALPVSRLLRDGRGRYEEAIAFIEARSRGPSVRVSSDHDFRNGVVLEYHAARMQLRHPLDYVTLGRSGSPPEWVLIHRLEGEQPPTSRIGLPGGAEYELAGTFAASGPSGWTWFAFARRR